MKRYISYFITCLSFTIMIVGCAQWGGDNPIGITGGSEEGYGQNGALNLHQPSDGNNPDLVGSWRYIISQSSYTIWTFSSNGNFTVTSYYGETITTRYGSYSTSGESISITIQQQSNTGTYSIQGNHLTITLGGDSTTLTRVVIN